MPNYQGDNTKLITSDYLYNNLKNLYDKIKSEDSISEFQTNKQYKVNNLVIYNKKLYRCIQEPTDITQFVDTDWEEISKTDEVKLPFTTVDKTTIDFSDLPSSDNYVLNGTLLDVQFSNTICSVVIDTDLLTIVTLDGKVYQFNTSTSTKILEDTFQIGQDVLDKIHDSLYTTIPEIPAHYELSDSSTSGALVIVADGALSNPDTEIELSSVTPLLDGDDHLYAIGEYVIYVNTVNSKTEEIYRKVSESYSKSEVDALIVASSTGIDSMTQTEFENWFDTLTITSSNYTP